MITNLSFPLSRVALEDVERNVGFKFFGKLDRSKADDLVMSNMSN